jgi:hypothetical protein
MPSHGAVARPLDLFEHDPPRLWLVPRRDVIGAFNWDRQEQTIECSLKALGLDEGVEYVAFDYWANEVAEPIEERLRLTIPGRSCRMLAVKARSDRPQLVSTSRHVTQGMIDVTAETWELASRTLRGTSRVVGGDTYELRIVVPDAGWKAKSITLDDNGSGVFSDFQQVGALVRATLRLREDEEVDWAVEFE